MTRTPDVEPSTIDQAEAFLAAYTPNDIASADWGRLERDAKALVAKPEAGNLSRNRVKADIQTIAKAARILIDDGVHPTLDVLLNEASFITIDRIIQRDQPKMAPHMRGVLRRLAAVNAGLPWRQDRRPDGERFADRPDPSVAMRVAELAAQAQEADSATAEAFLLVHSAIGDEPAGAAFRRLTQIDSESWSRARAFAAQCGTSITKREWAAAAVYDALARHPSIAVVAHHHALTRENLELGLHLAAGLPRTPNDVDRAALRG
jgi:hypothetical protein